MSDILNLKKSDVEKKDEPVLSEQHVQKAKKCAHFIVQKGNSLGRTLSQRDTGSMRGRPHACDLI